MFIEEPNSNIVSELFSDLKEDSLKKEFGNISSINGKDINNFHNICKKCYSFRKLFIIDPNKIQLICQCENSNESITLDDALNNMIYIDSNDCLEIILKCKEDDEKYGYFCLDCKKNKCRKCCLKCDESHHNLMDLNRDIKTRQKKDYIETKLNERYEYFIRKELDNSNKERNFNKNKNCVNLFNEENFQMKEIDNDINALCIIKVEKNNYNLKNIHHSKHDCM